MINHILPMIITKWIDFRIWQNPEGEGRKKSRSFSLMCFFLNPYTPNFPFFPLLPPISNNSNQLASSPLDCIGVSFFANLLLIIWRFGFFLLSKFWIGYDFGSMCILFFSPSLSQFSASHSSSSFLFFPNTLFRFSFLLQEWWKSSNFTLHFAFLLLFLFQQLFTWLTNGWRDGPLNSDGSEGCLFFLLLPLLLTLSFIIFVFLGNITFNLVKELESLSPNSCIIQWKFERFHFISFHWILELQDWNVVFFCGCARWW